VGESNNGEGFSTEEPSTQGAAGSGKNFPDAAKPRQRRGVERRKIRNAARQQMQHHRADLVVLLHMALKGFLKKFAVQMVEGVGDGNVFAYADGIFQKPMHKNNIFARKLFVIPDAFEERLTAMHHRFQPEVANMPARLAETSPIGRADEFLLRLMKCVEESVDLPVNIPGREVRIRLRHGVQEHGVTFELGKLQGVFCFIHDGFEERANDLLGVEERKCAELQKSRVAGNIGKDKADGFDACKGCGCHRQDCGIALVMFSDVSPNIRKILLTG